MSIQLPFTSTHFFCDLPLASSFHLQKILPTVMQNPVRQHSMSFILYSFLKIFLKFLSSKKTVAISFFAKCSCLNFFGLRMILLIHWLLFHVKVQIWNSGFTCSNSVIKRFITFILVMQLKFMCLQQDISAYVCRLTSSAPISYTILYVQFFSLHKFINHR